MAAAGDKAVGDKEARDKEAEDKAVRVKVPVARASLPWVRVETASAPPAERRFPISKVCRVSRPSVPSAGRR